MPTCVSGECGGAGFDKGCETARYEPCRENLLTGIENENTGESSQKPSVGGVPGVRVEVRAFGSHCDEERVDFLGSLCLHLALLVLCFEVYFLFGQSVI